MGPFIRYAGIISMCLMIVVSYASKAAFAQHATDAKIAISNFALNMYSPESSGPAAYLLPPGYYLDPTPSGAAPQLERSTAIDSLKTGQEIQYDLGEGKQQGRFVRSISESIIIESDSGEKTIPVTSVQALWARKSGRGNRAVLGMLIVGLPALAFGMLHHSFCSEAINRSCWQYFPGLPLLGAGVGAFMGSRTLPSDLKWRPYYRSPEYKDSDEASEL